VRPGRPSRRTWLDKEALIRLGQGFRARAIMHGAGAPGSTAKSGRREARSGATGQVLEQSGVASRVVWSTPLAVDMIKLRI
jgi:hypothetical protein